MLIIIEPEKALEKISGDSKISCSHQQINTKKSDKKNKKEIFLPLDNWLDIILIRFECYNCFNG